MNSFSENRKKSKNGCFLAIFGLILAMFLTSRPYNFDAFAHAGAPLGVEWLCKISWKSYGQFLRNLKFSWKGREKKKDAGVRPIPVGNMLCRICSKCELLRDWPTTNWFPSYAVRLRDKSWSRNRSTLFSKSHWEREEYWVRYSEDGFQKWGKVFDQINRWPDEKQPDDQMMG